MISFKSIFKAELSDFLLSRKAYLSKSAFDHDCCYLKRLDSFLYTNEYKTKALTEEIINKWLTTLKGKSSSIANEVIVIKIFIDFLNTFGISAYSPPVPKVLDDYIPYIFSDYEIKKIFTYADNISISSQQPNHFIHIEFPMILRLMYSCGLRIGETVVLKMKDIDIEKGILTLKETKGDKQRIVPMHLSLVSVLEKYCLAMDLVSYPNKFLFPENTFNVPVKARKISSMFNRVLTELDISLPGRQRYQRGPCLHCLRHVFVFKSFLNAEENGYSIYNTVPYLSIYLGHDSIKETEKYMKFSNEMYPKAMDMFEDYTIDIFPELIYEE